MIGLDTNVVVRYLVQDDVAWRALRAWTSDSADLSDALIGQVGLAAGCTKVATFDRGAAKLEGFELLG